MLFRRYYIPTKYTFLTNWPVMFSNSSEEFLKLRECNLTISKRQFERFMKICPNQKSRYNFRIPSISPGLSPLKKKKRRQIQNPIPGIIIYNDEVCWSSELIPNVGTRLKDIEPNLITSQRLVMAQISQINYLNCLTLMYCVTCVNAIVKRMSKSTS